MMENNSLRKSRKLNVGGRGGEEEKYGIRKRARVGEGGPDESASGGSGTP